MGRVITGPANIEFIDNIAIRSYHTANGLQQFDREAIGPLYVSGSVVAQDISGTTRRIQVTNGNYYYGTNEFMPDGKPLTESYLAYRHVNGVFEAISQTEVDNTSYDDGTNLVSLSTGFYTKHSFYIVSNAETIDQYLLVYGQAEYSTLENVEAADLPLPPTYFNEGVVLIASIIAQQGSNILTIFSERPF